MGQASEMQKTHVTRTHMQKSILHVLACIITESAVACTCSFWITVSRRLIGHNKYLKITWPCIYAMLWNSHNIASPLIQYEHKYL